MIFGDVIRMHLLVGAFVSLAMLGCATSKSLPSASDSAAIETRIAETRGLKLRKPISIEIQARPLADAPDAKSSSTAATTAPDVQAEAGRMIGFDEYGVAPRTRSLLSRETNLAGYYDRRRETIVILEGSPSRASKIDDDVLLAHELTHAIQFQNFDIEQSLDRAADRYDRYLALNSMLEGDATFTSLACGISKPLDRPQIETIKARLLRAQREGVLDSPTASLGNQIEYVSGTLFVIEAYERGGWAGVNQLYQDPPRTTREVVEPSLYFDRKTEPRSRLRLAGYQEAMSQWKEVVRDTLGIAPIAVILSRGASPDWHPVPLRLRWTDDQLAVLKKGRELAVVWMIAFDDSDSAWAFANSYRAILDRTAASEPHHVENHASLVLVTVGKIAADQRAADAIWRASGIEPPADVASADLSR
jgi:hypothetical protein